MVSGLDLRYLSFCDNLRRVSFAGCPISKLPDYRKIVLKRLPPDSYLDDVEGDHLDPDAQDDFDRNALMTAEDANLLKELVADGLLVSLVNMKAVLNRFLGRGRTTRK